MNIVFINSVFNTGSTGKIVYEQKEYFELHGHNCYMFMGRGNVKGKNIYKISNKLSVFRHICKTRLLDQHELGSKKNTLEMVKQIKEIKPDVIFLHNLHGYYINLKVLFDYLKHFEGKICWTFHDSWPISGHSAYIKENRKPLGVAKQRELKEYPRSFFINNSKKNLLLKKQLFLNADFTIVTPSNWLNDIVSKSFLKNKEIITINNGVNTEIFYLENKIKENKIKVILAVANIWEPRKGLKFINKLADDIDMRDVKIILIGRIPSGNKVSKKIRHIKKTENQDELRNYYNLSDVYVNPTMEDNFPTTNLEALVCGLPVVTFETGGSSECLINPKMGTSVERGNYESLKKEICVILNKSNYSKKIEISNLAKVFSKKKMLDSYDKLIF